LRPFCLAELWAKQLPVGLPAFDLERCCASGLLPLRHFVEALWAGEWAD
jgi:hypothetical protein